MEVQALGQYFVNKWGAQCQVELFPMQVTEVIAEAHRKEAHRKRRWVEVGSLSQYIKDEALLKLSLSLSQRLGTKS